MFRSFGARINAGGGGKGGTCGGRGGRGCREGEDTGSLFSQLISCVFEDLVDELILFGGLNHPGPALSQQQDGSGNVDLIEGIVELHLLQADVYGQESSRPANTRGAMSHHRSVQSGRRTLHPVEVHPADELTSSLGCVRYPEVWPLGVMKLNNLSFHSVSFHFKGPHLQERIDGFGFPMGHDNTPKPPAVSDILGPVGDRFLPIAFDKASKHDDDRGVVFPHHQPEVQKCVGEWSLAGNVGPL